MSNNKEYTYLGGLVHGVSTLLTGMKVTVTEFFTKKVTEQYPENRDTLQMFDRFRGTLNMPHDAEGNNKCIACGLCPDGLSERYDSYYDGDGGRCRDREEKETARPLRIRPRCMYVLPTVRERLSARCYQVRPGI